MKNSKQIVGNTGLFYACYKLSSLGWNALPTSRNARGIDIVAYRENYDSHIGIQVKSLSKRDPAPVGDSLDKVQGDFWIIVHKLATESPVCFILKPDEVKSLAHGGKRGAKPFYWLQPPQYDTEKFREAWSRIG